VRRDRQQDVPVAVRCALFLSVIPLPSAADPPKEPPIMFAVPPNTVLSNTVLSSRDAVLTSGGLATRPAVHPVRVATAFAADRARWAPLLRYDPEIRWSALLEDTGDYEVWLMSWLPGQYTVLHDHSGAVGAFTVISGSLTERVIHPGDRPVEITHAVRTGQSRVFGPGYVHQVTNTSSDPAVSIHVYLPARQPLTPYEFTPTGELRRIGQGKL
jgi:quercetin dioxygenase-like cupin family protein